MNRTKKTLFVVFSAAILLTFTSCAASKKTGCPAWSKAKVDHSIKKSV